MNRATVITNETVEDCIDKANQLRQEGKLDEAIALYQRAIELDPNSYQSYHYMGETLAQKDELEAAANFYNLALEINPEFFWSYHCLGLVLFWQGKLDEAIAASRKAIEIEPNKAIFHYQLGQYLERQGHIEKASAAYKKAITIEPDFSIVRQTLENLVENKKTANKLAFLIPELSKSSSQNEDILQILLFAASRIEQELARNPDNLAVSIISVNADTSGWEDLSNLFSKKALDHISLVKLEEPTTPNLCSGNHKTTYDLLEYLKNNPCDEIHYLDYRGVAYYASQAKHLGLYFLETIFAAHIVGGTVFRKQADSSLVDDVLVLMDDLLEIGSIEKADAIYVHDNKAWSWYLDKIELSSNTKIYDLSHIKLEQQIQEFIPTNTTDKLPIVFYGLLSEDGGLPLFCNAISRVISKIENPFEIVFIGSPRPIAGMDAISYIRLRSAKWGVPVKIEHQLTITEEIALIAELNGIVFYSKIKREGLRCRLIESLGVRSIKIDSTNPNKIDRPDNICSANPGKVAKKIVALSQVPIPRIPQFSLSLTELWQAGRIDFILEGLEDISSSPSLQLLTPDRQPKVSVCITHFSRPQKLREAIDSIRQQTYSNLEVIVTDDGSPDPEVQKELAIIKEEIQQLGWKLVSQENKYLGAARNFGMSHAKGDYILFMDDDNLAKPQEIETLVAIAKRTGGEIINSFCDTFETDKPPEAEPPRIRFTPFGADPALGAFSNCYGDANALFSKEVLDRLGGFTEDYGLGHEDWELFSRASLMGVKMVCVPEPLFWYRVDSSGMLRSQLHKSADLKRSIRPFIEHLPYHQAKLVLLAQGLVNKLPVTVEPATQRATPKSLGNKQKTLPYGRVAVITRTKDRPLLLARAVQSVLSQTFKDWILVIVNDGGKVESVELVVDRFKEELNGRVVVIHNPTSLGMETASNLGISNCDSDYIVIHDDDDSWKPTFLARTVSHLDNCAWDAKLGGVVTWSNVIIEELEDNGEITIQDSYIFNDSLRNISILELAVENRFPPISFIFRRAALDVVGPFDGNLRVLGDWEFHLRILRKFNIDVITEPLANYHHRPKVKGGIYSNSVHGQSDFHQSTRVKLMNDIFRQELAKENGLSLAQLLSMGDMQSLLIREQNQKFQQLNNYIWTIEQFLKFHITNLDKGVEQVTSYLGIKPEEQAQKSGRNVFYNGDFRIWGKTEIVENQPAYSEVCPNVFVSYNGDNVSYRITSHQCQEENESLPQGKTYLHLENDGVTENGNYFFLEFLISSALIFSDQPVCISGVSRLQGADSIKISGRHFLGNGRQIDLPWQQVNLSSEFKPWSCSFIYPSIDESEIATGHHHRIFLISPHNKAFEFDLTNFQVEFGEKPTAFEYL
ncbi:MAG: glycosyltransferase [Xenococcaceae cyanobacterium MO_188.B32]|nr:glycosyltransferase [Xenococcaceae cyanobacterium MO_188.B32]